MHGEGSLFLNDLDDNSINDNFQQELWSLSQHLHELAMEQEMACANHVQVVSGVHQISIGFNIVFKKSVRTNTKKEHCSSGSGENSVVVCKAVEGMVTVESKVKVKAVRVIEMKVQLKQSE